MKPPIHILIIENDILLAANIQSNLQREGIVVAGVASNMNNAIEIIKKKNVDIALIDIELDGPEDGVITAIELIKIKWIPIIYMTGNTPFEVHDRMKKTFPAAFLEKPLRVKELHIHIELALNNFNAGNIPSANRIEQDYIFVPTIHGLISVKVSEIIYIKADRVNSLLYLTKTETNRLYPAMTETAILVMVNKGRISARLPSHFFELSRSLVINLDHVNKIDSSSIHMHAHSVNIPEGRKRALMERLTVIKNN